MLSTHQIEPGTKQFLCSDIGNDDADDDDNDDGCSDT
jgi:hypothetical protein